MIELLTILFWDDILTSMPARHI